MWRIVSFKHCFICLECNLWNALLLSSYIQNCIKSFMPVSSVSIILYWLCTISWISSYNFLQVHAWNGFNKSIFSGIYYYDTKIVKRRPKVYTSVIQTIISNLQVYVLHITSTRFTQFYVMQAYAFDET